MHATCTILQGASERVRLFEFALRLDPALAEVLAMLWSYGAMLCLAEAFVLRLAEAFVLCLAEAFVLRLAEAFVLCLAEAFVVHAMVYAASGH